MIDTNELRRLTQAATPGPWIAAGPSFGESLPKHLNEVVVDREGDEDDGYSICNTPIGLDQECSDDMAFIAAANPLAIEELLDRLEAAEKSRDDLLACLGEWLDKTKWVQQGSNEGTISAKYIGLHRADVMARLLDEAEKERDALRSLVVMRFDHDHPPQFTQGYDTHKLTEPVTAEHCRWFVDEIERLSAEVAHTKEVEFPRKAQAVADAWRTKCERLEAKIAEMEKQEPVATVIKEGDSRYWMSERLWTFPDGKYPLYALPGAQTQGEGK